MIVHDHDMRTSLVIDDALLKAAMKAGPYDSVKDAVEAGLRLLARKAAYRDILALQGKLQWDGAAKAGRELIVQSREG